MNEWMKFFIGLKLTRPGTLFTENSQTVWDLYINHIGFEQLITEEHRFLTHFIFFLRINFQSINSILLMSDNFLHAALFQRPQQMCQIFEVKWWQRIIVIYMDHSCNAAHRAVTVTRSSFQSAWRLLPYESLPAYIYSCMLPYSGGGTLMSERKPESKADAHRHKQSGRITPTYRQGQTRGLLQISNLW